MAESGSSRNVPAWTQGYETARGELRDLMFKNSDLTPEGMLAVAIAWACHGTGEMAMIAGKERK